MSMGKKSAPAAAAAPAPQTQAVTTNQPLPDASGAVVRKSGVVAGVRAAENTSPQLLNQPAAVMESEEARTARLTGGGSSMLG